MNPRLLLSVGAVASILFVDGGFIGQCGLDLSTLIIRLNIGDLPSSSDKMKKKVRHRGGLSRTPNPAADNYFWAPTDGAGLIVAQEPVKRGLGLLNTPYRAQNRREERNILASCARWRGWKSREGGPADCNRRG